MAEKKQEKSALSVSKGVEQPPDMNEEIIKKYRIRKKRRYSVEEYTEGIISGNRNILSQAITLIESSLPGHHEMGQKIIENCLPHSSSSVRIGITGVPGVGKSTFIESFGKKLTSSGRKIAVLAIDPTSQKTKGSILGDKTRMERLSTDPNAFIRPSPSGGSLGGVARKTRESIILCEAAGFDTIFIETVGVGQSETAVHSMVDFFLLLMLAGAGDELQGIKRGIMEMADLIAITKADGDNIKKAQMAKVQYENALRLFPPPGSGWLPGTVTCSSVNNSGLTEIWENIVEYTEHAKGNGYFESRRREQARYWMHQTINEKLKNRFYNNSRIKSLMKKIENDVIADRITSFEAARRLIDVYYSESRKGE